MGEKTEETADCIDEKACTVSKVGTSGGRGTTFVLAPMALWMLWSLRRRRGQR